MNAAEIARLEEIASNACNEKWGVAGPSFLAAFDPPTVLSLLTALEQSQAALAEAEALVKELRTQNFGLAAGQCPTAYGDEYGNARCREQDVLRARLEVAKEALKPFADEEADWALSVADSYHPGITEPNQKTFHARAKFSIGDLRRARAAIAEMEKGT